MRDLLPDPVRGLIRDRYLAGVSDAEAKFQFSEADEDALTGALGQSISTAQPIRLWVDGGWYEWHIYYRKLRGRGPGAPEKHLGADGIFQIEARTSDGKLLRRKGLPFQAKKGWSKTDRKLVEQARNMLNNAGAGIIVDYTKQGYTSCAATDVLRAEGQKRALGKDGCVHPLGQVLANDFLDCDIGVDGLYFDVEREEFLVDGELPVPPTHALTTSVVWQPPDGLGD